MSLIYISGSHELIYFYFLFMLEGNSNIKLENGCFTFSTFPVMLWAGTPAPFGHFVNKTIAIHRLLTLYQQIILFFL